MKRIGKAHKITISGQELKDAIDVTFDIGTSVAEVNNRGTVDTEVLPTARVSRVQFTADFDPQGTAYTALRTSLMNVNNITQAGVPVIITDGGATVWSGITPSENFTATMVCEQFTRVEGAADCVKMQVSLRPYAYAANAPEWAASGSST